VAYGSINRNRLKGVGLRREVGDLPFMREPKGGLLLVDFQVSEVGWI